MNIWTLQKTTEKDKNGFLGNTKFVELKFGMSWGALT